jgi:hypothetical protein
LIRESRALIRQVDKLLARSLPEPLRGGALAVEKTGGSFEDSPHRSEEKPLGRQA